MIHKYSLVGIVSMVLLISGCKASLNRFEGNYIFVKKIDEADKSETVYTKGTNRYNRGYIISVSDNGLSATPMQLQKDGKAVPTNRGSVLQLKQTDDEVFQYKKSDSSRVLTFAFSGQELRIMEFNKDRLGNLKEESTLELNKK